MHNQTNKEVRETMVRKWIFALTFVLLLNNAGLCPAVAGSETATLEEKVLLLNEAVKEAEYTYFSSTAYTHSGYFSGPDDKDCFTFGRIEQDGNYTNGPEDILWRVLARQDGSLLVISEYALDARPYHNSNESVTWEDSSLRKWLNTEFFNAAFTNIEKASIRETELLNTDNPELDTPGGNNTRDHVFLLSAQEAAQYFSNDRERCAKPSAVAAVKCIWSGPDAGSWLLRTPGKSLKNAVTVTRSGQISFSGAVITGSGFAIRPAMWVDDKVLPSSAESSDSGEKSLLSINNELEGLENRIRDLEKKPGIDIVTCRTVFSALQAGDLISYGRCEQDGDSSNGPEDILWRILAQENGKILVISEYALAARPFHSERADIGWADCDLRGWLNEDFFFTAFSAEEQGHIFQTNLERDDNPADYTTDRVFLLSHDETDLYFASDLDRRAYAAKVINIEIPSSPPIYDSCPWWLRSKGDEAKRSAKFITTAGFCGSWGADVDYSSLTVRPAMWLDASLFSFPLQTAEENWSFLEAAADTLVDRLHAVEQRLPLLDFSDSNPFRNLQPGDEVVFGNWDMDEDEMKEAEPIYWRVLRQSEGKTLLVSKYVFAGIQYHETSSDITWEEWDLRKWLNNDFYVTAFPDEVQKHIALTTIENHDNALYGTIGGADTSDRVFLLSIEEAETLFTDDLDRRALLPPRDYMTGAYGLRSPGFFQSMAAFVDSSGKIKGEGSFLNQISFIRPALWVE